MKVRTIISNWMRIALAVSFVFGLVGGMPRASAQSAGTVLTPADTTKLLPPSVFFRGQSATTQLRNSGGVKFSDGMYLLATMVDTSGYASDVAQKYQAYLIAEVPVKVEGHDLPAGIYGIGFIAGDKFNVLDVGAHELFTVSSHADAEIKRPTPLKVVADQADQADQASLANFRLYEGRNYVAITR